MLQSNEHKLIGLMLKTYINEIKVLFDMGHRRDNDSKVIAQGPRSGGTVVMMFLL